MSDILAVDDSSFVTKVVKSALEAVGFTVTIAGDGLEALGIAKRQTFELVLTDMVMPKMDGLQLIRELRAMSNFRFTPIIVLTSDHAPNTKAAARSVGATGFLAKPFDRDKLVATIEKVLG